MSITVETKLKVKMTAVLNSGKMKTHDCEIGEWWGDEICSRVNISEFLKDLPDGEYEIIVKANKIN